MNTKWIPFIGKKNSPSEKKSAGDLGAILEQQLRGIGNKKAKVTVPIGTSYESISKQGYMNAVAVYFCTSMIAQKAGTVPIQLFQKAAKKEDRTEIYSHPILDLIRNPGPRFDWESYIETWLSYFFLDGNVYERPIEVDGKVKEMIIYSPEDIELIETDKGRLVGYKTNVYGKEKIYNVNNITLVSKIKHFKNFNPLSKNRGLSVLTSASTVIDIQNSGDAHNYNMLQNQARPSGALSYEPEDGAPQQMDEEQFERLKEEISLQYSGAENTGRPLLLEGGLKWIQMSLSARDLDYLNSRGVSQKDVCRTFKVPAVLLGLDNDSTYNNVREARLGLWDDAITPILNRLVNHWNKHVLPLFEDSEGLELVADYSNVSDLETRTERVWKRLDNSDFLTLNEKRNAVGLDPIEGGNTTFISSGDMPLALLNMGIQAANINEIVSAGAQANNSGDLNEQTDSNKIPKEPTKKPVEKDKKSFETKASDEAIYELIDKITIIHEKKMDKVVIPFMKGYGEKVEQHIIDHQEMGAEFALVKFAEEMAKEIEPVLKDIIMDFGELTLKNISKKSDGKFLYKADEQELIADIISAQEATAIMISSEWVDRVAKYAEREAVVRAKYIEDNSRQAIRGILNDGVRSGKTYVQMAKEANNVLSDKVRSMKIVRTEVHAAREYAGHEASMATGMDIKKRWLSSFDERTRGTHVSANGQTVMLNEKFVVGGSLLDHPGDPSGSAKEVINCRCTVLYEAV